jgi:rhodanese-related sulfurtransferase
MRRTFFILIGFPAMLAVALLPASGLTVAGLQEQLAGGSKITVIDIRRSSSFRQEHIPGAINIPAPLCPSKNLPPLGQVVVYGDGLGGDAVEAAAAALTQKPGLKVEVLEGGFAAWKNSQGLTTRGQGMKRESFNYITYARLKAMKADGVVLLDMRKPAPSASQALTDLNAEFPGMRQARSSAEAVQGASGAPPLVVLIDNGDGASEAEARRLKAGGTHSYVILAGGELILARKGQAGLQRNAPGTAATAKNPSPPGAAK